MTKISNQYSLTNILTADLANSRLGINNVSPTVALDVTGAGKFSGSVTSDDLLLTAGTLFGTGNTGFSNRLSDTTLYLQMPATGFNITDNALNTRFILSSAGIATFTGAKIQPNQTEIFPTAGASNRAYAFNVCNVAAGDFTISQGSTATGGTYTTRFIINPSGSVGIGTTAPGGKLDVRDTGIVAPANGQPGTGLNIRRSDGVLGLAIGYDDSGSSYLQSNRMDGNIGANYNLALQPLRGNVLIATYTDNGYKLYVNGNAAGPSGFANVSDRRLKKDITPIESALNKVKLLNGVSFNWDKTLRADLALDDKNHLGLIAQDVEEVLPQVVSTGIDELKTKTITYSDIVPVLIEAIKELSAKVSLLENK